MGFLVVGWILFVTLAPTQRWEKIPVSPDQYVRLTQFFKQEPETLYVFRGPKNQFWIEGWYPDHKEVIPLSSEQWARLTQGETLSLQSYPPSSRIGYLIGQTLLGLSIYSWSFPWFLNLSNPTLRTALGLFMPFSWFGIHWMESGARRVTESEAWAGFTGGLLGAFHGSMLFQSPRAIFPVSVAENLLDRTIAHRFLFSPGVIQRKVNYNLYGFYHAYLLSDLLGLDLSGASRARFAATLSLVEGYLALGFSRSTPSLTPGDALFELRFSVIGGEFGPAILTPIFEDRIDPQVVKTTSLIGQIGAQILAQRLSLRYDLPVGGAVLSALVPYLVHGVTAGLGVLFASDTYWRYYPMVFLATDLTLTWQLYRTFRHPQGSLPQTHSRLAPFITLSSLDRGQKVYGLLWMW